MTLPNPEDVTSATLVSTISKNSWVKARANLIRDYAITETALKAADEVEALIETETERIMMEGDPLPKLFTLLETWIKVTRETAKPEETP